MLSRPVDTGNEADSDLPVFVSETEEKLFEDVENLLLEIGDLEDAHKNLQYEITYLAPEQIEERKKLENREVELLDKWIEKRRELLDKFQNLRRYQPGWYKHWNLLHSAKEVKKGYYTSVKSQNIEENWYIDKSEIQLEPDAVLGKGAWGQVIKGKCRGKDVAVKRLTSISSEALEQLKNEAKTMASVQHENVLLFMGLCIEEPMLVTEFMKNGDVFKYIRKNNGLSFARKMKIARDIALGMYWLAKKDIVHLDLKTSNFLISDQGTVKVADFGFSRTIQSLEHLYSGTYNYAAPELLRKQQKLISSKTDVFSFGLCLWEIFGNPPKYPWQDVIKNGDKKAFIERVAINGERPPMHAHIPRRLQDLICRCWAQNPQDRPSFDEIIESNVLVDITMEEEIKDEEGRKFWDKYFYDKFEVAFTDFMNRLCKYCEISPKLSRTPEYLIFKHLFAEDDRVKMERFGKVLKWIHFTPGIVSTVVEWYTTTGFWGFLSRPKAEQFLGGTASPVCFLVRLSENREGTVCVSVKDPIKKFDHLEIPITAHNTFRFQEGECETMKQLIEKLRQRYQQEVCLKTDLQHEIENIRQPPRQSAYSTYSLYNIYNPLGNTAIETQVQNNTNTMSTDTNAGTSVNKESQK
jgi:serine/threonine protein kinase